MRKIVYVIVILFCIVVLCSCTIGGVFAFFFGDKDNDFADARMEEVFDAIKEQDKDALKAIFSTKALAETETMDVDIDALFSFIQGEVVSWSRDESPVVFDYVEYGDKIKQLLTWYTLYTDEHCYLVFLVDYPIDTIEPENAGLYSLIILGLEDEGKMEEAVEELIIPGICILDY